MAANQKRNAEGAEKNPGERAPRDSHDRSQCGAYEQSL